MQLYHIRAIVSGDVSLTHELPHKRAAPWHADEFFPECAVLGALAEAEKTDENVLLGILVTEERLPATVGGVVAPEEFEILGANAVVNLMELGSAEFCVEGAGHNRDR